MHTTCRRFADKRPTPTTAGRSPGSTAFDRELRAPTRRLARRREASEQTPGLRPISTLRGEAPPLAPRPIARESPAQPSPAVATAHRQALGATPPVARAAHRARTAESPDRAPHRPVAPARSAT